MKTPAFWSGKNLLSSLLAPLGCLYALATAIRIKRGRPRKIGRPVICVGNITAGGTGKTPTAVSIAGLLQTRGLNPFFVSRGYGGKLKNILVDIQKHSAAETGDEPLILARQAPVVINPDRVAAAQKALQSGAELIIMDDGFQNPGLRKDLSFLVFDGAAGIGNGLCIPAGPLREKLDDGLKRAQAVIILGEDKHNLRALFPEMPVFHGRLAPIPPQSGKKEIIAFAGIGRPEKFYASLRELGFTLLKTLDFTDHHRYGAKELTEIINTAGRFNADIYTTAKDFVKIPLPLRPHFHVLEIEVRWKDAEKLTDFILEKIR